MPAEVIRRQILYLIFIVGISMHEFNRPTWVYILNQEVEFILKISYESHFVHGYPIR